MHMPHAHANAHTPAHAHTHAHAHDATCTCHMHIHMPHATSTSMPHVTCTCAHHPACVDEIECMTGWDAQECAQGEEEEETTYKAHTGIHTHMSTRYAHHIQAATSMHTKHTHIHAHTAHSTRMWCRWKYSDIIDSPSLPDVHMTHTHHTQMLLRRDCRCAYR